MANTVAQMTREELRELIETVVETAVEQKLREILGDPDADLEIRKTLQKRLLRQQRAVAAGERGQTLEDVVRQLGLE
jgi:vacuolar-type H+-ATPase subunit E/Vma4